MVSLVLMDGLYAVGRCTKSIAARRLSRLVKGQRLRWTFCHEHGKDFNDFDTPPKRLIGSHGEGSGSTSERIQVEAVDSAEWRLLLPSIFDGPTNMAVDEVASRFRS